jgi:hypothetical protein
METNSRRGEIKPWLSDSELDKGPKLGEVGVSLAHKMVRRDDRGVIREHFWPTLRIRANRREEPF